MPGHDIITIGASAGGVETLSRLMATLPDDLPAALFVVLHIDPEAPSLLSKILAKAGRLPAVDAQDGVPIERGKIYVATPNCHLLVEPERVRVIHGPRENRHRPAIDPLFRSAAWAYGPRVVGVILSGMLDDGSAGLWAIKSCGGLAVVQDPAEAHFPDMPANALAHVEVDSCLPIAEMGPLLARLAREPVTIDRPAVPELVKLETEFAMTGENSEDLWSAGHPSAFTCPSCHGVVWELREGDMIRYRCHIGHAFSPESFLAEQTGAIENALGSALRALKEKAAMARRMAERFQPSIRRLAVKYEEEAEEVDRHARTIRGLLENPPPVASRTE
jgi:two-component system chemotaxis response regulator CheB